ncbi:hypothetical protein [Ruminococcus sp.]|uniref:hypothetical protein n=1 Tax=Ruminococcus sp. TaxID=41978 RepID=UPI002C0CD136|nr:hypothetical protein [Ruminococcus sp.]HOA00127.1 hypothetical protein [Ruminococcus sp.]HOH86814.1 hypothetical protein [Ruminococcus sp.]
MILPVIIPLLCFGAAFAADIIIARKKSDKKAKPTVLKKLIAVFLVLSGGMLMLAALASANMIDGDKGLSAAAVTAVSLLSFAAVTARPYADKRLAGLLKKSAVCAAVLIAAEVLIFNGKSFTRIKNITNIPLTSVGIDDDTELTEDNNIRIKSTSFIYLNSLPKDARALEIDIKGEKDVVPFDVKMKMTDDDLTSSEFVVQHKHPSGNDTHLSMTFRPYGKVRTMSIFIERTNTDLTISGIRALSAPRYSFSDARYFFLLILCIIVAAIKEYRFYSVVYDRKKTSHIFAVAAMTLAVVISATFLAVPDQHGRPYPDTPDIGNDPFAATFDAFMKKQSWLDLEVDPRLAEMSDPYDNNLRAELQVGFNWDYAFYKGHYYCYFGAAPVVTFYYPYYKLTGFIPTLATANNFFTVLGSLFVCTAILAFVRAAKLKANLLMLLLLMPTAAATVGIWHTGSWIDRYTLPSAAGICFLMLCLAAGFTAVCTKKHIKRCLLLFVSGAALALCVGSRPTISLCAVVLIPFFVDILRNKKLSLTHRLVQAASFTLPVAVGAVLIMLYNNARFDSPFQFGNIYQLTVNNPAANDISLTYLPDALLHYFVQPCRFRTSFPFIETFPIDRDNYTRFFYIASGCGVLSYPVILLGMFLIPHAIGRKENSAEYRRRRLLICVSLAVSVTTAWLDFCMGGIVAHYIFDFMPLLFMVTMTGIFRSSEKPSEYRSRYVITAAIMAVTMVFSTALNCGNPEDSLLRHFPHLLDAAEDTIIFWQ